MLTSGPGVVEWVSSRINTAFTPLAVGLGWDHGGFIAGAVFDQYTGGNIYMHFAKLRGWQLTPTFVAAIMDYPFRQLGVRRMSAAISSHNVESLAFARHLGARLEGVMKEALPDGDLHLFGLLRKDAEKWLTEPYRRRLEVAYGSRRTGSRGSWPRQAASSARA